MNNSAYENPIRLQVLSLPDLVETQLEACFGPNLRDLMTIAEMFDTRKIILTGCGDSYAAALAMAPVIEKYCDCFGVTVMRAIEFTRFTPKSDIGIGEPNSPLVIGISASGGAARIVEVMKKANQVGAFSILLTNNPNSPSAKEAKRVFVLGTPSFPNDSPGLRSYFASLIGEIAFAARLGLVRGTLPPGGPESWKNAIAQYVGSYRAALPAIDEMMANLATQWKDFEKFDFIGDDVQLASAFFGAAKIAECCGTPFDVSDSEDWCHINYFLQNPASTPTVVMADKYAASFGRVVETIASAHKIGRPVLVVTNAGKNAFIEGVTVCTLPDTPEGFPWLMPLMDFTPVALLAGHISGQRGLPYFRATYTPEGSIDPANPFFNPETFTLKTSEIKIIDTTEGGNQQNVL